MASFIKALAYTLKHEGGWSEDPDDPGGATNFGITLKTARKHGVLTAAALKGITQSQVTAIYLADYWRFDGIDDQRVATKLFDMSVNMGTKTAISYMQRILNIYGAGLAIDGIFGPATQSAVNSRNPELLLDMLCGVSGDHYRSIVAKRPASAKFFKGWLRRAAERPTHA